MWAGFRIWAAASPEELSTQERPPYSMVTGMEGGSRWTRCSMGLLAQPRDSDMARNPTSPLGGSNQGLNFSRFKRGSVRTNRVLCTNQVHLDGGGGGGVRGLTWGPGRCSGKCTASWCRPQTCPQTSF